MSLGFAQASVCGLRGEASAALASSHAHWDLGPRAFAILVLRLLAFSTTLLRLTLALLVPFAP